MRLWYLSHRRPAKAQASLRIHAVSPQPSLFAHIKYGSRRRVRSKIWHLAPLDGCTMSLRKTKSTVTSWGGSFLHLEMSSWSCNLMFWACQCDLFFFKNTQKKGLATALMLNIFCLNKYPVHMYMKPLLYCSYRSSQVQCALDIFVISGKTGSPSKNFSQQW